MAITGELKHFELLDQLLNVLLLRLRVRVEINCIEATLIKNAVEGFFVEVSRAEVALRVSYVCHITFVHFLYNLWDLGSLHDL